MLNLKGTSPTVCDDPSFDPEKDVEALHNALSLVNIDHVLFVKLIANRSNAQRQILREKYLEVFGKDLLDDVEKELVLDFKKTMVSLLQKPIDFYAIEVHEAISKKSSDTFIEILGPLQPSDVRKIRDHYQTMYSSKLSDDISKVFKEPFRHFALHLISDERSDSMEVDAEEAKKSLETILNSLSKKTGKEDQTIISIINKSNMKQLSKICEEYKNQFSTTLSAKFIDAYCGDFEETFVAMLEIAESVPDFYAKRLKKSMKGLGTNDAQLIRIIVSRSEIDLGAIGSAFQSQNSKSLRDWIIDDTSAHYRNLLLTLISKKKG